MSKQQHEQHPKSTFCLQNTAVKRATSGKFTATDMEGLKGGVDQGDGWVTFKLGKGDDLLGLDGEDDDDYDDDEEEEEEDQGGSDSMDARLR